MSSKINFIFCLGVLFFILIPELASARFLESDVDRVDQEERLNTETYNDKMSYRYPAEWNQVYEKSDAAVRLNAGSLNANRFDYYEDLKIYAANDTAGFQFYQHRHEDVLEQTTIREIRASGFFENGLYVSMVADGGTFKEYGDVGWALGYGDVRRPLIEILYWSVDHFYDTKKSDPSDFRSSQTWSLAMKSNVSISDKFLFTILAEYDHPLKWERPSRGYTYGYQQQQVRIDSSYKIDEMQTISIEISTARKHERKTWDLLKYEKLLERQVNISELKWSERESQEVNEVGIGYIDRRANYEHNVDPSIKAQALPEDVGPNHSKRDEAVLWATRYKLWIGDRHYMQYGFFLNYVNLKESRHDIVAESKAQWAWEYRYQAKTRVVLNTTWDINQLSDDFPYKKRSFKPWGGGDIQFIAAF
jgi:hypothetical protein